MTKNFCRCSNQKPIIDKAFDYDGDVFGMLHNDAVDVDTTIEKLIVKLEKGTK